MSAPKKFDPSMIYGDFKVEIDRESDEKTNKHQSEKRSAHAEQVQKRSARLEKSEAQNHMVLGHSARPSSAGGLGTAGLS